jgi:chromosome partitioning protein
VGVERISNLDKARENARLYAEEILRRVPAAKAGAARTAA